MGDKRFMKGNEAIAEAAIRAGCMAYYGYPITPQNELTAYMAKEMPRLGRVFIQTESEIAAINCVLGSSSAGFRAMTSSASTAMSLKQEGLSQSAYLQIPLVVVDMNRGGPGMGNILQSQADYNQATRGGGSGDYQLIVLAPNSVQEAADLTKLAFDLSDKYQNPAMLLGDGTIGQMMELVEFPEMIEPGDIPPREFALSGCKGREPMKTLPRNSAEDLENFNIMLQRKYDDIRAQETRHEALQVEDADIVVVAYGSVSRLAHEMVAEARKNGIKLGLFRPITLWPYPEAALREATKNAQAIVVLEHNCGMMTRDVRLYTYGRLPIYYHGRIGGSVIDNNTVYDKICEILKGNEEEWRVLNEQQGLWKTYQPDR